MSLIIKGSFGDIYKNSNYHEGYCFIPRIYNLLGDNIRSGWDNLSFVRIIHSGYNLREIANFYKVVLFEPDQKAAMGNISYAALVKSVDKVIHEMAEDRRKQITRREDQDRRAS